MNAIAMQNDLFRGTLRGGHLVATQGFQALPESQRKVIIRKIRNYNTFSEDNDPHGEHDFGSIVMFGHRVLWKIDYYDNAMRYRSPDPSDPTLTIRVLTLMLAEEY